MAPAPSTAASTFGLIDWSIVAAYLLGVFVIGAWVGRRRPAGDDFFLAGRRMPVWAVAISVLATSLSAATFIGGPEQAFLSNLTYLSANIGAILAVIIVAVLFIPAFYRHQVTSVYELLGHRFGGPARPAASAMFMIGRVFASGARLYMVALPFAMITFGNVRPESMLIAIVIIAIAATAYTLIGGIRAVIWTDVMQAIVVVGTVSIALGLLALRIDLPVADMVKALRDAEGGSKLMLIDLSTNPQTPYTLWTALFGFTLFNLAALGTDQDLTQRMLTCRTAREGAWSAIVSQLLGLPVVALFLGMGLLLFIFYERPELVADPPSGAAIQDTRRVFLRYILEEMPTGMRGLMIAGLFAAAMSSMDSALNAMASTTISDFFRPLRQWREGEAAHGDRREVRASRLAILFWSLALAAFASICVFWQQASGVPLIDFAIGVMVFAYGGLLGVFLTALLTRRGNAVSATAALVAGFLAVLIMQNSTWRWITGAETFPLAFPWKMLIATAISFTVCAIAPTPAPGK